MGTMVDQLVPPSADLSIMYPVMAEPPLSVGAVHDRLICDDDIVVAVRLVGGCGAVGGGNVVADTGGLESADQPPPAFHALTS